MNYQKILMELVKTLDYVPKLLLHSCCAPCSTTCISFLTNYFDITILYYNPNIEPIEEYEKRKEEQIRLLKEIPHKNKLDIIDIDYDNESFLNIVKGLELEKEGGIRCHKCYELRLRKTALIAKEKGFDYFGTTLSVSPYKNSQVLNELGKKISEEVKVKYLFSDFKKNEGYKKSIELSEKYNLYRQKYCGCRYGRNN